MSIRHLELHFALGRDWISSRLANRHKQHVCRTVLRTCEGHHPGLGLDYPRDKQVLRLYLSAGVALLVVGCRGRNSQMEPS